MNPPPAQIDGATVIEWAWSEPEPFGEVPVNSTGPIFGLAIAKYDDAEGIYRFSCDRDWSCVQDEFYNSAEEAKEQLPEQYRRVAAIWRSL
ncbi:hypothetical protein [Prosthecobacter sp.]|uniref:hypothetical protein n=1 Tax=Prosthecobacter sp. TaxID=1965333 RepID=UPI0024880BBF|nr:hypothetical protein [Prosthecobacter sp.]MDI1313240.1 hypothetical protein [Prosthecobacter sp.]